MNKLKTIGLSALAGSLAVATASNAVEYGVSGDAYVVFSSEDSTQTDTASGKHFAKLIWTCILMHLTRWITVTLYLSIKV